MHAVTIERPLLPITRYPPPAAPSNLRSQIEVVLDSGLAEDLRGMFITPRGVIEKLSDINSLNSSHCSLMVVPPMNAISSPQRRASRTRWGALCIGISLCAQIGHAQTSGDATGGRLQEIVVTATRHEENLSRVPLSVTALSQESIDIRGIKDIQDLARFTPGVNIDNTGTNNISIRGIASTGGAGTTGIYVDDTPIQMRALAFNPDETLPKTFDVDRVEVLRGPQGTLFGAGSEGGTIRYITTQPSLTTNSVYSRNELSFTQGGAMSVETGVAAGGPLIDNVLGVRATVWYQNDGGWIDRVSPTDNPPHNVVAKNANSQHTTLVRLAAIWAPNARWSVTPSIYYQDRKVGDASNYWSVYSNPSSDRYVSANPAARPSPDKFYLPALKIDGDFDSFHVISNTSYYHRQEETGYDGTLYNLGFYQAQGEYPVFPQDALLPGVQFPLLDGNGIHLPSSVANYQSPASVNNGQQNFTQEVRLQSSNPSAPLTWTTGLFFSKNRQSYLEQIHDPMLNQLSLALTGQPYTAWFYDLNSEGVPFDPAYPNDSYFLHTEATDQQVAWFGEATYALTDTLKATVGARFANNKFSFNTLTGGPQLFGPNASGSGSQQENSFTPKVSLAYQHDPSNLFYATYSKGFRPGGANNPVPFDACSTDFSNFGVDTAPGTYKSDTVQSYEIGTKNSFDNRVRIASSIYYIKWNNIQQTVVPPICQISWIQNLGGAIAKGADVQAEFAVTDHLTTELAVGYTDARYSQSSYVGNNSAVSPVAASGDAISGQSGQPAPPVTASLGMEYRFSAWGHDEFVRADYEYQGRAKWASPGQDANSLQYDPANYTLDATHFVTARAGVTVGSWQIAAYVDNLLDAHTVTNYAFTIDSGTDASRLQRNWTFRPRTIGLTFTYRR